MSVNVVYVQDYHEACERSKSSNPLYIGHDDDLFRLNGVTLHEESPPIYVSWGVTISKLMGVAVPRFRSKATAPTGEHKQEE